MTHEEALARRKKQVERLRKRVEKTEERFGRPLTGEEVALIARAEEDAAKRLASLTPRQSRQLQKILDEQAALKKLQRHKSDAIRAAEESPSMTSSMIAAATKGIERQYNREIKELKKQFKESKADLKKMLSGG